MPKKKDKKDKKIKLGVASNYPVGDFLIRVKNASLAHKKEITVRRTKLVEAVAEALVKEGYLNQVKKEGEMLLMTLSYRKKEPEIFGLKLVSKPGLRVYLGIEDLEKRRKPSILLISTPKGIISGREALKARVGGEVIVEVW